MGNGALVHKGCHPKNANDVAAFAAWWKTKDGKNDPAATAEIVALVEKRPSPRTGGRGRPKLTPEEKSVKALAKLGISTQDAHELIEDMKLETNSF